MKQSLSLAMAMVCLAVAGTAMAYPSLAGPTGTGVLPSAVVAGAGQLNIAANGYAAQQVSDPILPILVEYGAGKNMEVGGGITAGDITSWSLNGKLSYPSNDRGGPDFAIGGRFAYVNTANDGFARDAYQVYGVASKDFHSSGTYLRGSVGLNLTDLHYAATDNSVNALRAFVSVNFSLPNRMNLAIDYQFRNIGLESSAMYSVVARYPFTESFAGEVGFTNMNLDGVTGNDATGFFAGINYIFTSDK